MYTEFGNMNMFHGMGMLFWFLIFIIIIMIAFSFFKKSETGIDNNSALDILKNRYAKGEINKEEFEEIKKGIT